MPAGPLAARPAPTRLAAALVLGLLAVAVGNTRVAAQPAPLTPDEQKFITAAVDRGVNFLKQAQKQSGSWGEGTNVGSGGGFVVGHTALAGITLYECGVKPDDKQLKAAAGVVRQGAEKAETPYEIALAILFLSRMDNPNDKPLIQRLAVRLIVGQTPSGGWAYKVPTPAASETNTVLDALRKMTPQGSSTLFTFRERPSSLGLCIKMSDDIRPKPPAASAADDDPGKARTAALAKLTPGVRKLPVFQDEVEMAADPKDRGQEPVFGTTDNSNTHFATIGLWAASRKYDVPTDRTFALLVKRFRVSQNGDGTWAYPFQYGGGGGGTPAMTSVALLVLAIGHALGLEPEANPKPEQDPQILKGLTALSNHVGEPAGEMRNRPAVDASGGLYFFWAMERIAVLYDLRTLGNKDWYKWGAEILVSNQLQDGSWAKGGYHGENPVLNTCFAVLFLKRANLLPDLARRLAIDSNALTAKKDDPPPKMEEPTPEPEPTTPSLPTFPDLSSEPAPKATTTAAPAPPAESPAAPKEERPMWPWIVGLLVLLIAGGCALYFAMAARKKDEEDDDEDEDRPRKKKGKAKGKGKSKA